MNVAHLVRVDGVKAVHGPVHLRYRKPRAVTAERHVTTLQHSQVHCEQRWYLAGLDHNNDYYVHYLNTLLQECTIVTTVSAKYFLKNSYTESIN